MLWILNYALQFLHFEGMHNILKEMVVLGQDMILLKSYLTKAFFAVQRSNETLHSYSAT